MPETAPIPIVGSPAIASTTCKSILAHFATNTRMLALFDYGRKVLTDRQYFWHFFWMVLVAECALGCLFIEYVPCNRAKGDFMNARHRN